MKIKHATVRLKAGPADGLAEGQFEAYASIFGNVDSYGDVVRPGAFAKTLEDWAGSASFLPVLFGHNMMDPDYNIGHVVEAVEDEKGLRVLAQLDLDTPKGQQVHKLLKGKRINQMSFAYDVIDGGPATVDGVDVWELREVKVYEISVVTIGANDETEILAVKMAADVLSGGLKEGRVLSAKHVDSLRAARDSIDAVLEAAEIVNDQGKASGTGDVKDEGAERVKFEETSLTPSARTLAWKALEAEISAGV